MKRGDGFTALIWIIMMIVREDLAGVSVPPPTDVEVICQNLNVHVGWNYSRAHAQSSFTVTLNGNNRCFVEHSTVEHQYDLTHHIWSCEDMYMNTFYVMVTATVGGNQSEPAFSRTFTFSNVETAAMTCQLDFPPVKLVRSDLDATLSFSNPFHFYKELRQAVKTAMGTFSVTVTSDNGIKDFSCSVKEETCKHDIVFAEGAEYCVTLDGVLFAGNLVGHILFKTSDRICAVAAASKLEDILTVGIGVLLGVLALAAILAVVIVVAKRSSSNAPLVFPSAIQWSDFRKLALLYVTVSPEDTCMVHATPRNTEPSLSSSCSSCQESRAGEDQSSEQELAGVGGSSGDEDTDSELVSSGYNHPHCLVDMGNGDMVSAYKE